MNQSHAISILFFVISMFILIGIVFIVEESIKSGYI